jgi:mono/diheme cytochrome c family protein
MPAFASRLSDEEVATLASFVRQSWGNAAPAVKARSVKAVRENALSAATVQ